jgi:Chromo (CHRromatin Organisation MOdifier) domain
MYLMDNPLLTPDSSDYSPYADHLFYTDPSFSTTHTPTSTHSSHDFSPDELDDDPLNYDYEQTPYQPPPSSVDGVALVGVIDDAYEIKVCPGKIGEIGK